MGKITIPGIAKTIAFLAATALLAACAAPAAPNAASTKPAAATSAPTVATKPAAAATSVPGAATIQPAAATPALAASPTPAVKIKRGGTVRTSFNSDWGTGDLHLAQLTRTDVNVYTEGLVDVRMNDKTQSFDLVPQLAESWEKPDPTTIVFKLRKGVKFHDGSEWNAEVARWNLLRMRDHPKSMTKDSVRSVDSIDVVDSNTLRVKLKAPSASALWGMTSATSRAPILSKAAFDQNGEDWMASHIVGTGPFVLVDWKQGDRQVLKKFADYWDVGLDGQKKPYLDGVEIRWIADSAVAFLELRTGNLHFQNDIQPRDVPAARSNPDLVLMEWPSRGSMQMMGLAAKNGPFQNNLKLRQAAQYAIDREAVLKAVGQNSGILQESLIYPGQVGYKKDLPGYKYDFEKAKQLVAESGHPSGVDAVLTVVARQPDLPQSEVLKSMLDKAGIRTKIDPIERVAWSNKIRANGIEMTTYSAGGGVDSFVTMQRRLACEGISNFAAWCNKDFETAMADSEKATSDAQRAEALQRAAKVAYDDAHFVYLWVANRPDAFSKKLHGYSAYAEVIPFWADLWMD